jgi:SAM-dependent methyltransferase
MSSVTSSLARFFRRSAPANQELVPTPVESPERIPRRSSGFAEFMRRIKGQENLSILDLGSTSPANIQFLTGLGHKVYNEDVLQGSLDPALAIQDVDGKPAIDVHRFLTDNLQFDPEKFDAVLCWDVADYLNESLVKPMVERLHRILRPEGALLGFFHTKDAGPEAPFFRYHIGTPESLNLQSVWKAGPDGRKKNPQPMFRLQRVFNNRHVENLFRDYSSLKFFLARDNIREVIVLR